MSADLRYGMNIQFLEDFENDIHHVNNLEERYLINDLKDYIYRSDEEVYGKVCLLYGLRRTGKTTMMFQTISDMDLSMQKQSVFINCTVKDNVVSLVNEMLSLIKAGYKYFFIDEVTKMPDFVSLASLFSDRLAKADVRIVLTGTDSLSLWLAKGDELFDRNYMIHTTYIPFYDFKHIFPEGTIDDFIEYGGTLSHEDNTLGYFQTPDKTFEYIDNAICDNILHSLAYYDHDGIFSELYPYYSKNELKNIIHRIIQLDTHKFTENVVLRKFKMGDYSVTAKNLAKRNLDVAQEMMDNDQEIILEYFKKSLEVFDTNEKIDRLDVYKETVQTLKMYLEKMDVVTSCKCFTAKDSQFISMNQTNEEKRTVLSQTGIRYSQAKSLVESIQTYYKLETKPKQYKEIIVNEILNCVKGGLLEDLITVNCQRSLPARYEVFKVMFDPIYGVVDRAGEFDMVVYDKENHSCELYEIKHDSQRKDSQITHLIDKDKVEWMQSQYGNITKKAVLYMGESIEKDGQGIEYMNANEFLDELKVYDRNYEKTLDSMDHDENETINIEDDFEDREI